MQHAGQSLSILPCRNVSTLFPCWTTAVGDGCACCPAPSSAGQDAEAGTTRANVFVRLVLRVALHMRTWPPLALGQLGLIFSRLLKRFGRF